MQQTSFFFSYLTPWTYYRLCIKLKGNGPTKLLILTQLSIFMVIEVQSQGSEGKKKLLSLKH